MPEMTGDNIRTLLRTMTWSDRRTILVSIHKRIVKDQADPSPFTRVLEALYHDIYAAEDEERALAEDIEDG